MPVVSRQSLSDSAEPIASADDQEKEEMFARFDLQKPLTTSATRAPESSEVKSRKPQRSRREAEYKPFFTQIGKAIPNKQHNRVVMIVPLLLVVALLLFVFAYVASK